MPTLSAVCGVCYQTFVAMVGPRPAGQCTCTTRPTPGCLGRDRCGGDTEDERVGTLPLLAEPPAVCSFSRLKYTIAMSRTAARPACGRKPAAWRTQASVATSRHRQQKCRWPAVVTPHSGAAVPPPASSARPQQQLHAVVGVVSPVASSRPRQRLTTVSVRLGCGSCRSLRSFATTALPLLQLGSPCSE